MSTIFKTTLVFLVATCCQYPRSLVSQETSIPSADSSIQETSYQPGNLLSGEADQPALRFDFKWAEQFHLLVDSIQNKDGDSFVRIAGLLKNGEEVDAISQTYERDLLLWFLSRCVNSREAGLSELSKLWNESADRNWDWDTLFALNDILDRLYTANDPQKVRLKQGIQEELTRKFARLEKAHGLSIVINTELSSRAFRYLRRLPNDEKAVGECQRLLRTLEDDFGLYSILLERLSSLHKKMPERWQEQYHSALLNSLKLLNESTTLRKQFPLATPKVRHELSRLQSENQAKIRELTKTLEACDEASRFLSIDEKLIAAEKLSNQNTLKELRASALLDGYRIYKTTVKVNDDPQSNIDQLAFAPSAVIVALQQLVEVYRNKFVAKYVNAQLSLAGVLFDSLGSELESVRENQIYLTSEKTFLKVLDETRTRLDTFIDKGEQFQKYMGTCQDFELSWIEWTMKQTSLIRIRNEVGTDSHANEQRASKKKSLLEPLTRLQRKIRDNDRKTRAITDIGYLHLMYGDYQEAINALQGIEQNHRFAASVIRCLANKDSGNMGLAEKFLTEAEKSLTEIDLDADSRVKDIQELIVLLLKSELTTDGTLNRDAITELRTKLEERKATNIDERNVSLVSMLELNNEHHQALADVNAPLSESPHAIENKQSDTERQKAFAIWEKHLAFKGENESFIRARAAYSLASHLLTTGSNELATQKHDVNRLVDEYKLALKTFTETDPTNRLTYDALTSQLNIIRDEVKIIRELEKQQLNDGRIRGYCLDALKELPRDGSYPSLTYNVLCLALRVQLLSPSDDFSAKLSAESWPLDRIAKETCEIALTQRMKVSDDKLFGTQRNLLFVRYRDAFDLAVEVAVSQNTGDLEGRISRAALLGSETTNQTMADLFNQEKTNTEDPDPLRGRKFISFFVGKHATHVFWRIGNEKVHHHRASIERSDVTSKVSEYVKNYLSPEFDYQRSSDAYEEALELKKTLFCDALIADLSTAAALDQCIYVIPHGPLFQLPIDTLPIGGDSNSGQYLASQCPPLIYLPSLSIRGGNSARIENSYSETLLTIQPYPNIGNESEELFCEWLDLGATRVGPDAISSSSENLAATMRQPFDGRKFLDELERGYRFVHIGSHGAAAPGSSNQAESQSVKTEEYDLEPNPYLAGATLDLWNGKKMSASCLIERFAPQKTLRLNTELVFLSACETQVTDNDSLRYGGNTIKAMGTAFLVAGAENVIASHWPVSDASTKSLVIEFMRQAKRQLNAKFTTEDYALILHQQRRELAKEKDFSAPFDWGPFTLSTTLLNDGK
ncbi:MAG: CHAT domain-containing protein [Pirellulaceae bacterium]|nr:CHAT domain-containing protein [Pirellulaceae bacterium]